MGVVDLRMTRPPRPAGGAGITKRADDDISGMKQGNIAATQGTRHNESDQRTKGSPAGRSRHKPN